MGKKKLMFKIVIVWVVWDKLIFVKIYYGFCEFNFYINFYVKIMIIFIL